MKKRCDKGIPCGGGCVSSLKECRQLLDQDRMKRMAEGKISRSPEYRSVNDSRVFRVQIQARTGQNYELSTDRKHLAQRFYDNDFDLPEDTKATVVAVRQRKGVVQITLQDLAFKDRFGRYVKEEHVNLFVRGGMGEYFLENIPSGTKLQLQGLQVEQYTNDPDRFGVRSENLKFQPTEDYAERI